MLTPLPYHTAVTEHLRKQDQIWKFFANKSHRAEHLHAWKTDLLKMTYKFSPDAEGSLYALLDAAKLRLGLSIPVTLYQQEGSEESNASIAYLHDEAHIVFSGKILRDLSEKEQLAIIAHELGHILLFKQMGGDLEIADNIITALGNSHGSSGAHYETARLFKLNTEIFCDRVAFIVCDGYSEIITALVKIATGLHSVNPDSYIRQADEIFASDRETRTTGISHPENFIRARALSLWNEKGEKAEQEIRKMIEGQLAIGQLDLFKQLEVQSVTKVMINRLLLPEWMQTEKNLNLANEYFPDTFKAGLVNHSSEKIQVQDYPSDPVSLHRELQDYLSYVLYDFATADKELEELPLAHCFRLAEEAGISAALLQTVKKEHKLTDKKTNALRARLLGKPTV